MHLTGWLCKIDSSDFTSPLILALIYDLKKSLPGFLIISEFDNWNFTSEYIHRLNGQNEIIEEQLVGESEEIIADTDDFEAG